MHIGDYDPTHSGYEFFTVHEDSGTNSLSGTEVTMDYGMSVIDPANGTILFHKSASKDTGRGMMANVGAGGYYQINGGSQVKAYIANGDNTFEESSYSFSNNFRIFWDGDVYDELLDGTNITSWDENSSSMQSIFTADNCISVNGSKANPSLQADLFGDWREEVVYPTSDNTALRVFATNIYTDTKMKSLMYDGVYRSGVAAEQTAYNQPPHIGYYFATSTTTSTPTPTATTAINNLQTFDEDVDASTIASGVNTWDSGSLAGWFCNFRQDGTNSFQVADGKIQSYVQNKNGTYFGVHATTVDNAADKKITFGFDYQSNSGTNTGNAASEIGFVSYDKDDVTYNLVTDSGLGFVNVLNDWGMTNTNTVYSVTAVIDNLKNTFTLTAVPQSGGDTITKTVDLTVDINTIYFRTGRGKTDTVDNFYCTVESAVEPTATPTVEPTATPTIAPTATPTVTPTATPTIEPTATPTIEPTPTITATSEPTGEPTVVSTNEPISESTTAPTETPSENSIAPIGNFIGKVAIERNDNGSNIELTVTNINDSDIDLSQLQLIYATYDNDKKLNSAQLINAEETGNTYKFTVPATADLYKIMLWDKNYSPVINMITNERES
jgi:hypothetical protein